MILRGTIKGIFFWILLWLQMWLTLPSVQIAFPCDALITLNSLRFRGRQAESPFEAFTFRPSLHPSPFCGFDIQSIGQSLLCKCPADNTERNPVLFCLHECFPQDCSESLPDQFHSGWGKEECGAGFDEGTFPLPARGTPDPLSLGQCCSLRRSTAGSLPFAHAQTVMTEAINVVMRVWHPRRYFLQGLSNFSENIRSGHKSAFSLPIPKHLDLENLVH